ncbi:retrovirus-related pol polyprotein from transposon TNT 1-94 [Tanacetum coccineum]
MYNHEGPHTEDIEGPLDLINTEGTHEQNVQNDQMITQPTDVQSWNKIKVSGSIIDSLVPNVTQSHISNQASTSSHPVPQDICMAAKLIAASTSECLFADFLSKIEPKKVSEALKHPRWVDAMQEELNQFYRNKVWTLVPLPYGKTVIGSNGGKNGGHQDIPCLCYIHELQGLLNGCQKCLSKCPKALYGLKQEPRAWNETLPTFLIQNKFTRGRIDNILFFYKSKGDVLLVQVYVDDIIFGSTSYKLCKQFEKLMTKKFEMSMMGELTYFLGLQIKQDEKDVKNSTPGTYSRNMKFLIVPQ